MAKPDFEVNNMHQRTEDWLERNVNGIIGLDFLSVSSVLSYRCTPQISTKERSKGRRKKNSLEDRKLQGNCAFNSNK